MAAISSKLESHGTQVQYESDVLWAGNPAICPQWSWYAWVGTVLSLGLIGYAMFATQKAFYITLLPGIILLLASFYALLFSLAWNNRAKKTCFVIKKSSVAVEYNEVSTQFYTYDQVREFVLDASAFLPVSCIYVSTPTGRFPLIWGVSEIGDVYDILQKALREHGDNQD
ncbi:MAG: hypothetical protein Q4D38_12500 [Planctomycetia bacterium]|nr:hypothetical protein [Planctomycetia bacterium]